MKSSCSCTWTEDSKKFVGCIIPAGEKVELPVRLNTGISQDEASGKIVIHYQHLTESKKSIYEDRLILEVRSTVKPDYRIDPEEIDFGEIDGYRSQKAEASFAITPVVFPYLELVNTRTSGDMLKATFLPNENNFYPIHVDFDLLTYNSTQQINGYIVVETNSKTMPNALIPVKAKYIAPAELFPDSIVIASDRNGDVSETICVMCSVDSKIIQIDCGKTGLIHSDFEEINKKEHQVSLTISESGQSDLDEIIRIDLELLSDREKSFSKSLFLPVYRFKYED